MQCSSYFLLNWSCLTDSPDFLFYFAKFKFKLGQDAKCFRNGKYACLILKHVVLGLGYRCDHLKSFNPEGQLTIILTPAAAWATALSPSDRLSVRERPTTAVSAERRLISSPVWVRSKKATSCRRMEAKTEARRLRTIFCPKEKEMDCDDSSLTKYSLY